MLVKCTSFSSSCSSTSLSSSCSSTSLSSSCSGRPSSGRPGSSRPGSSRPGSSRGRVFLFYFEGCRQHGHTVAAACTSVELLQFIALAATRGTLTFASPRVEELTTGACIGTRGAHTATGVWILELRGGASNPWAARGSGWGSGWRCGEKLATTAKSVKKLTGAAAQVVDKVSERTFAAAALLTELQCTWTSCLL